jgi:mannose-6-phosphate isomerase-like protein (cupin superfamily)
MTIPRTCIACPGEDWLFVVFLKVQNFMSSTRLCASGITMEKVKNPAIYSEERPWGHFERYSLNESITVKLVYVAPNRRLSLQFHNKRDEFWKVIRGPAEVRIDDNTRLLIENESIAIPRKTVHRLGALDAPVTILEISYGQFDEADIVRLQDDYSRQVNHTASITE